MRALAVFACLAAAALALTAAPRAADDDAANYADDYELDARNIRRIVKPKFLIVSMFVEEAEAWYGIDDFDLLARKISLPGLSPLYPDVHCTKNGDICQVITGEAEINAAATLTALVLSHRFDLRRTYIMVGGIAGINPKVGTTGDVTFARYSVQVALQYEFDAREIPANFSTGYVPQGAFAPGQYPQSIYGTEAFEVNVALQQLAAGFARRAALNDTAAAATYRAKYAPNAAYAAATHTPSVRLCDSATADNFWAGPLLGDAFDSYMTLVTNGSAVYCTSQQEDNATLEGLLRGALAGRLDFARIILMRTASDFDRPYPGQTDVELISADPGAFPSSLRNIYLAGREIIHGIVGDWARFQHGAKAPNYIGDILDSLPRKGGAPAPDFGLPHVNAVPAEINGGGPARRLGRRAEGRQAAGRRGGRA